jgi:hypothetical protein
LEVDAEKHRVLHFEVEKSFFEIGQLFSRKSQLFGDLGIEKFRLVELTEHLFPSPGLASLGFLG